MKHLTPYEAVMAIARQFPALTWEEDDPRMEEEGNVNGGDLVEFVGQIFRNADWRKEAEAEPGCVKMNFTREELMELAQIGYDTWDNDNDHDVDDPHEGMSDDHLYDMISATNWEDIRENGGYKITSYLWVDYDPDEDDVGEEE